MLSVGSQAGDFWAGQTERVFMKPLGTWVKFPNACVAVPMQWAVETAWTQRRVRSLCWATAESERESAHGGELEKRNVSTISREHMRLSCQLITFQFLSHACSRKGPHGSHGARWTLAMSHRWTHRYTDSQNCQPFWNPLSCLRVFPVCG